MVNERRHMAGGRKTLILCGALGFLLAGCEHTISSPVTWWHDYEGGEIAKDRPPPPGANEPYPNFAQLPVAPAVIPAANRQTEVQNLTESRNLALAGAAAAPLPILTVPPPAKASPPSQSLSITSAAATAKPQAAASQPTAPAPVPAAPTIAAAAQSATPVVAEIADPPALATAAPAPAALTDINGVLGSVPAPTADFNHLTVGFDGDSAVVPREATPGLIAFAQAHQAKIIAITGYGGGDSRSDAALKLGWRRAKSVALALEAAGVPAADLRLTGEAPAPVAGRGAELGLLK